MRALRRSICLGMTAAVIIAVLAPPVEARHSDPSDILRFHVVARSDAAPDQARKYRVRDALLELLRERLQEAGSLQEARGVLLACMGEIENTAREAGQVEVATVGLTRVYFPAVEYSGLALPAGQYWALQVILDSGEGGNWWCVLFPSLCFGPASPPPDDEPSGASSLRFRLILGKVLHRMFTGGISEHSDCRPHQEDQSADLQ